MKEQRKEDVFIMEYLTNIAKDQDNIFLSSTMTGNIQLLRLEHIGYFRYNSVNRLWEAALCNHRSLALKRTTKCRKNIELPSSFDPNQPVNDYKCELSGFDKGK